MKKLLLLACMVCVSGVMLAEDKGCGCQKPPRKSQSDKGCGCQKPPVKSQSDKGCGCQKPPRN